MRATFATLVTLLAAAVSAVAGPHGHALVDRAHHAHAEIELAKRDCRRMPSGPDMEMVDRVYAAVRQRTSDYTVMVVVFITVRQESYFNNLNCGDQESHGLVQQKAPGYGWGSVADTMNPEKAIDMFLDVLMPYYNSHPGLPENRYAQYVQQAEAGDWYKQHIGWSHGFIASAKGRYEERKREEAERKERERQKSISISKSKASVRSSKSRASVESKSRSKASVTSSIQASITSELVASASASASSASAAAAAAAAAAPAINVGSAPKTIGGPEDGPTDGSSARVAVSAFAVLAAVFVAAVL